MPDNKLRISESPAKRAVRRFLHNPSAMISLFVLLAIALSCIAAPVLTEHKYNAIDIEHMKEAPSREHIFGTDNLGRDLFARILYGGRLTLKISFTAVLLAALGIIPGLIAGYVGGHADAVISGLMDGISSIPSILLVVFVENAFGWGRGYYKYAMALALMPPFVRLTRSLVINIMGGEYIEAARALGVSGGKIITRHVLRNIASPLIVYFTNACADSLIMCTVLGYLSIGVNPPTPEWGNMVSTGYHWLRAQPNAALVPCGAIVVFVLAVNIFGNGLRDALDVEER